MNQPELKNFLESLGIPKENVSAMAQQLEKRARQLSEKRKQSFEDALAHLVNLLKQGWAAKRKESKDESKAA